MMPFSARLKLCSRVGCRLLCVSADPGSPKTPGTPARPQAPARPRRGCAPVRRAVHGPRVQEGHHHAELEAAGAFSSSRQSQTRQAAPPIRAFTAGSDSIRCWPRSACAMMPCRDAPPPSPHFPLASGPHRRRGHRISTADPRRSAAGGELRAPHDPLPDW